MTEQNKHSDTPAPETHVMPIASWREQAAFEAWAKESRYEMHQHPLHYLFMDKQTNAARQGWKAALQFTREIQQSSPETSSKEADLPVLSEASLPTTSRLSQLEARKSCAALVNDPLRLDVMVSLDAEDGFKRELMNQLTRFVHDFEDLSVDDVAVQDLFAQHLSGRQNGFLIGKIIAEKLGSFGILTESTVFSDMEVVAGHDADSVFNRTSVHAVSSTRGHPNERVEPDYCFDPDDWEFTCDWTDRDQVHGHGDALNRSDPMRVCTLMKGPDKWVADVPVTWDENGDPEDTEVKWFDSEAEARVALTATTEGLDNA